MNEVALCMITLQAHRHLMPRHAGKNIRGWVLAGFGWG